MYILILFGMNSQHGRTPFLHWGCITQSQGLAENIVYFVSNAVACISGFFDSWYFCVNRILVRSIFSHDICGLTDRRCLSTNTGGIKQNRKHWIVRTRSSLGLCKFICSHSFLLKCYCVMLDFLTKMIVDVSQTSLKCFKNTQPKLSCFNYLTNAKTTPESGDFQFFKKGCVCSDMYSQYL